jgi:hypothetical protein
MLEPGAAFSRQFAEDFRHFIRIERAQRLRADVTSDGDAQ